MIGDRVLRQKDAQQVLDLTEAQAHGKRDGGELPQFVLVAKGPVFGPAPEFGDRLSQPLILRVEFRRGRAGLGSESLLHLAGGFVDRLAAPVGLLRLPSDGALLTGKDGGGVEDPGANG
jgi:hypothetical protein